MEKCKKVGIVGSGLIGRSWAMLFASAGYKVSLYDIESQKVDEALQLIQEDLKMLQTKGYLRGTLSADQQLKLMSKSDTLSECMEGAKHVQECVFERLDLKQNIFKELDKWATDEVVLSSSTSCFVPSSFSEGLKHRRQVIVSHPVNPPYYVPLVEIVPAPWTDPKVVTQTRCLMEEIGQKPVTLNTEINGFILNRIQYAILNECWRLLESGVASFEDVDTVMTAGLGMRYAFAGPIETIHLNAAGIKEYMEKYGPGIGEVTRSFGPIPTYTGPFVDKIHEELCKKVPVDRLQDRRIWRDKRLAALSMLKKDMDSKEEGP
ncbi:beta Hydroxy acid dehydrogenase 1 [Tachypleus tridentatus]|uniref:beta Hydroxy acid dehydrogenase 1 n=1 Tax=Tachypleus tridentatus TaxID=6853 RepID=UPI003FD24914